MSSSSFERILESEVAKSDLDRRGEAGGEEVGWKLGSHREGFVGTTGCELDAVAHGCRRRRSIGIGVGSCSLRGFGVSSFCPTVEVVNDVSCC